MISKTRWTRSIFILPLLLMVSPAAIAATTSMSFRLKGNTATAVFQWTDPLDPCVENFVSVVASDLIEKVSPPGGRTGNPGTVLVVLQRDACTDTPLFVGQGDTASLTFHVAGNLASATLTATVPVFDVISLETVPFQVNLSWKADGKPERLKNKETFADPDLGIKIKAMSRSTQVEATATGTVFGIGQNYAADASDTATIQKQNDGTHTVQKTP